MFMIYIYIERERERENLIFRKKDVYKILKFIKPFSDKNLWPCHFGNQKKEKYICGEKINFIFLKEEVILLLDLQM